MGNGNLQGGSTITMQYAKNYYAGVNTGRNFSTKLKEIFIAMKLGRKESKQWVMTNYLNTVPFGATIDGLGAAAENYFSVNLTKPRRDPDASRRLRCLPRCPTIPAPSAPMPHVQALAYTALRQPLEVRARQHGQGRQHHATTARPTSEVPRSTTRPRPATARPEPPAYLMNMVEQQLEAPPADGGYGLSQQQVDTGGYRITTTFSMAEDQGARPVRQQREGADAAGCGAAGLSPFQKYDRIGAVLENSRPAPSSPSTAARAGLPVEQTR